MSGNGHTGELSAIASLIQDIDSDIDSDGDGIGSDGSGSGGGFDGRADMGL